MPEMTLRGKINKPWQKFLDKVESYSSLPVSEWTEYQLLGYTISRVKEKIGYEISLSAIEKEDDNGYAYVNGTNPSRNPALLIFKNKIINKLHDKNTPGMPKIWKPELVKAYIDFAVEKSAKYGGFASFNYIANANFINEFKMRKVNKPLTQIERSTELPEQLKKILPTSVKTYGDLSFYSQAFELDVAITKELSRLGVDLCQVV